MKQTTKIALAVAAGAAALLLKKKQTVDGIGATHTQITGEVVGVEFRNRDINGNSSYWVYIKRNNGQFIKAYTAHGASLNYQINRMPGNVVTFDVTIRKSGGIVLNNTENYDWESHRL